MVLEGITEEAKAFIVGTGANGKVVNGYRYLGIFVVEEVLEREWILEKIEE